MLLQKSWGMQPELYILFINLLTISIPSSPKHCSNSAGIWSSPQAFSLGKSLMIYFISSTLIEYTSFVISPLFASPLSLSLYKSSTYSAHLSKISPRSCKDLPCLSLIYCKILFFRGWNSFIFLYTNWLRILSNSSSSIHFSL